MGAISDLIGGIVAGLGKTAIDVRTAITGVDAAKAAELEALAMNLEAQKAAAEIALLTAQIEVNKLEAQSQDKFVSRWRPAAGWTAVGALLLATWPKAIVLTTMWLISVIKTGVVTEFPDLGTTDVILLMGSMLGIAGMRTAEKLKGAAGNH